MINGNFNNLSLEGKNFDFKVEKWSPENISLYPSLKFVKRSIEMLEKNVLKEKHGVIKTFKPILFVETTEWRKIKTLKEHLSELGRNLG